jgi:hypothetical protein
MAACYCAGIIPAKASVMAGKAVDLMTQKVILAHCMREGRGRMTALSVALFAVTESGRCVCTH